MTGDDGRGYGVGEARFRGESDCEADTGISREIGLLRGTHAVYGTDKYTHSFGRHISRKSLEGGWVLRLLVAGVRVSRDLSSRLLH